MGILRNRGDTLYGKTITESLFYAGLIIGDPAREDALLTDFYREEYARILKDTGDGHMRNSGSAKDKSDRCADERTTYIALHERLIRYLHRSLSPGKLPEEAEAYAIWLTDMTGDKARETDALIRRYYLDLRARYRPDENRIRRIRRAAVRESVP